MTSIVTAPRRTTALAAAVIVGLLATLLTFFTPPAPAAAECLTPTGLCAEVPAPNQTGSPESPKPGGSCSEQDGVSPDTWCGYGSFDNRYTGSMLITDPSPLPPEPLTPVYGVAGSSGLPGEFYRSVAYNGYADQCKVSRIVADPATGRQSEVLAARGVFWKDTRSWTFVTTTTSSTSVTNKKMTKGSVFDLGSRVDMLSGKWVIIKNYKAPSTANYNVAVTTVTSTKTKYYSGRSTSYSCDYPAGPQTITKYCPTSIGPGTMEGPYDNSKTSPRFSQTQDIDPLTRVRVWKATAKPAAGEKFVDGILYSKIGYAYKTNPNLFKQAGTNSAAVDYVRGCDEIDYVANVSNTSCFAQDGKTPITGKECTFSPGNYHKIAPGKRMQCTYYTYPNRSVPQVLLAFGGCKAPVECTDDKCFVDAWANWKCNDSTGSNGRDLTYNFANCGMTDKEEQAVCGVAPKPVIYDPNNVIIRNGSQVVANGTALKVYWPAVSPKIPGNSGWSNKIENKTLQWRVAGGSQPMKGGAANASDQPVWGNTDKGSGASLLTNSANGPSQDGWSTTSLFLKFFQGTRTNNGGTITVGQNEVANPVVSKSGDLIPFGVYGVYSFSIPRTISTGLGGSQTKQIPFTCVTDMAHFYSVSGRVTG